MKRETLNLLIAASLAGAVGAPAASAKAATMENCYGVALKNKNDCAAAQHGCAGEAAVDYDGHSWKSTPKGTCTSLQTPFGPGSLTEINRPS